ncbi:hypothetical protein GCM10022204_12990 [Microlunatus aurantiacus]|uniref:Uncharacterized protein n=1 Tax=Microlunatus aurantiacus TaxID=446786 RepID=A0ABP7CY28_9ACTN
MNWRHSVMLLGELTTSPACSSRGAVGFRATAVSIRLSGTPVLAIWVSPKARNVQGRSSPARAVVKVVQPVEPPDVTIRYAYPVPGESRVAVAVKAYALMPEYVFCTRILERAAAVLIRPFGALSWTT